MKDQQHIASFPGPIPLLGVRWVGPGNEATKYELSQAVF